MKAEALELRTRVAELEKLIEWHKTDTHEAMEWKNEVQNRLSTLEKELAIAQPLIVRLKAKNATLLKASEGMEKALEQFQEVGDRIEHYDNGHECRVTTHAPTLKDNPEVFEKCKVALADFRAVKEEK